MLYLHRHDMSNDLAGDICSRFQTIKENGFSLDVTTEADFESSSSRSTF